MHEPRASVPNQVRVQLENPIFGMFATFLFETCANVETQTEKTVRRKNNEKAINVEILARSQTKKSFSRLTFLFQKALLAAGFDKSQFIQRGGYYADQWTKNTELVDPGCGDCSGGILPYFLEKKNVP